MLIALLISTNAHAALKITELDENEIPTIDDLLVVVNDPGGTPETMKMEIGSLETALEGVMDLQSMQGSVSDLQVANNITVNEATTATALAANGSNCSAGSFPLGVDASGASESCTTLSSSNAGTATALAANGANCSAGNYPLGVDASGAVESCTTDDDVPESGDFTNLTAGKGLAISSGTLDSDGYQFCAMNAAAITTTTKCSMTACSTTDTNQDFVMPVPYSGTIKNCRVSVVNAPGTAASGKAWTFATRVNDSAGANTCQILETAKTCSDTTHSDTVTAGDLVGATIVAVNTPASSDAIGFCCQLVPS